ncbi:hypothetical protein [Chloroflexus sp.]|uniref:hypothetical protein n=1 Tax=Chloroflexus sp. TaxID=1904827 RepID=UPI00262AB823|nr:hypothetical protein [uncultured Chloroflexus sp.]
MNDPVDPLARQSWKPGDPADSAAPLPEPELPRAALLRVSRSGGLRFQSHTITIYRNGLVISDKRARRPRFLASLAFTRLYHTLLQTRPFRLPHCIESGPDSYVYTIQARIGERMCRFEVSAHHTLPAVRALLRQLRLAGL